MNAGETMTLALASSGAVWQLPSSCCGGPASMEEEGPERIPASKEEAGPSEEVLASVEGAEVLPQHLGLPLQHPGLPTLPRQLLTAVHIRQVSGESSVDCCEL